ncbi:MAG: hypothetical protein WCS52_16550 [bacterium]
MKSQEAILRRREAEIKTGQEALAHALTKSLVLLRFKGNCKCGMMLTEQDKKPNAETYLCPHCGKSGAPVVAAATSKK